MIQEARRGFISMINQTPSSSFSTFNINRNAFAAPPIFKKVVQLNLMFSLFFTAFNGYYLSDTENTITDTIPFQTSLLPKIMSSIGGTTSFAPASRAMNFLHFDVDSVMTDAVVLPPYKDDASKAWTRGYIKLRNNTTLSGYDDFVFTGPMMKVTYGGCQWNKVVLNMDNSVDDFRIFLQSIEAFVRDTVFENPSKYKPGATTSSRFSWDSSMLIKPSREPDKYSDELRCRLSTFRDMIADTDGKESVDIVDAYFYKQLSDGTRYPIASDEIAAGDSLIPVFRVSYGRNIDRFFLILTLLKAKVVPAEKPIYKKISNEDWEMDIDENT